MRYRAAIWSLKHPAKVQLRYNCGGWSTDSSNGEWGDWSQSEKRARNTPHQPRSGSRGNILKLQLCVITYRRYKCSSWQTNVIVLMGTCHGFTAENNTSMTTHSTLDFGAQLKKTVLTHISATACYSSSCFWNGNLLRNVQLWHSLVGLGVYMCGRHIFACLYHTHY